MPAKLIAPIEKQFILERTDALYENDGDPTTVTIRQATQRQHTLRADKYSNFIQEVSKDTPDVNRYITRFSQFELMSTEVYLTMVDCNILDTNGKQLFKFRQDPKGRTYLDMTRQEFEEAWGLLESEVADEIWEKVREVNVRWRPAGEAY